MSEAPRVRWWPLALCLLYLPLALWLVLSPDGWTVNRLVVTIWGTLVDGWGVLPGWSPDDVALALNVLLPIPGALLIALAVPRLRWWWVAIAIALAAAAVETTQYLVLPGRTAELIDVVANTLGGLIGALTGGMINRRVR